MVEIDEPMGADSLVWLEVEGKQMSVRVPVELRPTIGSTVHLKVDIAKASLFDENDTNSGSEHAGPLRGLVAF